MRCRRIRRASVARAESPASDFAGALPSNQAPATCSSAMPTGPIRAGTFTVGWRTKLGILTGASVAQGSGPTASPPRHYGRTRNLGARTRDQAGEFRGRQMTPLPYAQVPQLNIHDSHALEPLRLVA